MSRSLPHQKSAGRDWWGKRPLAGLGVSKNGMRFWKRRLAKIERQQAKRERDRMRSY